MLKKGLYLPKTLFMNTVFLDFEEPIKVLVDQLNKAKETHEKGKVDMSDTIKSLEEKINQVRKEIYLNLTPWQRVLVSRHPERPYTLSYIEYLTNGQFQELHGDRNVKDDKAIVGGMDYLKEKQSCLSDTKKG